MPLMPDFSSATMNGFKVKSNPDADSWKMPPASNLNLRSPDRITGSLSGGKEREKGHESWREPRVRKFSSRAARRRG